MQIRLTVFATRGAQATARPCDVVVTAPAGTVLASVTEGLVAAALGASAAADGAGGDRDRGHETVPVYAGTLRLDPQQQLIGAPPLVDGAEVSLYGPAQTPHADAYGPARARLHVVAGPDAGGVHLLHGGRVSLGRSADADVPLDDPDVSRLHCAVTVTDSGELTVTDLDSTNGTSVGTAAVPGGGTVPLPPGATVRLGESAARVEHVDGVARPPAPPSTPDEEGHLRLAPRESVAPARRRPGDGSATPGPAGAAAAPEPPGAPSATDTGAGAAPGPMDPATAGARPVRRSRAFGTWARKLASRRTDPPDDAYPGTTTPAAPPSPPTPPLAGAAASRPDPATVLLTALGPGPRLWERTAEHPDALTVRIGLAHRSSGSGEPVAVDLRDGGSLGLAGPRARLAALARSVLAQLAALHGPSTLEMVLIAADRSRDLAERTAEWGWLGWLPHLRPAHGQNCWLLVAYDRDQAAARATELTRRLDETRPASPAAAPYTGPRTLLVVDGDPGPAAVRDAVSRLTTEGHAAGIHTLCLAETPAATPVSPLDATIEAAGEASPPFRFCGTLALLSGAVATAVRIARPGRHHAESRVATMDGVSAAWAERFARALAPLREPEGSSAAAASAVPRASVTLPVTCRLLDELGLARATPAALTSRWSAAETRPRRVPLTLGAGPRGPVAPVLSTEHGHLFVTGTAGTGKTELLRSIAASLAADTPPDRLTLALVEGDGDSVPENGLGACADLPHLDDHLVAGDPTRMREFAQALTAELKRRAELPADPPPPGRSSDNARVVSPRRPLDASRTEPPPPPLPHLVVLVDDFDTLVDPALGNPGRPSAPSVVRALEAVARDGAPLGVHLVAASGRPDRTADTHLARTAAWHVHLTGRDGDDARPGRGTVRLPDGSTTSVQAGRVTGRIPRTSTLRPTVVPLEWSRAGDPPTRRPVRELGNGPTDLALLASAMTRATRTVPAPRGAHDPSGTRTPRSTTT